MTRSRTQSLLIVSNDQSAQIVRGKIAADWPTLLSVSKQEKYVIPPGESTYKYTIRPFVLDKDELLNLHKRNLQVGEGVRSLIPKKTGSVAVEGKGMVLSVDGLKEYTDADELALDTAKDQNVVAEAHAGVLRGQRLRQWENLLALAFLIVMGAVVLFFMPDILDRLGEVDVTQVVGGADEATTPDA